MIKMVLCHMKL